MSEPSYFAITLLRDKLLPNLLEEDNELILYWAGKELAENFSLSDFTSLTSFFYAANFGYLKLIKTSKKSAIVHLDGDVIAERTEVVNSPSFALESGFLARAYEIIHPEVGAESEYTMLSHKKVAFTIHIYDQKV